MPGTTFRASFRVVNRSARTLVVPLDPSGTYLGGWLEEWLERLGPDPSIGARNSSGPTQVGLQPIDVLAALGRHELAAGSSITFPRDPPPNGGEIWTRGHPPGDYRYTVRRFPPPPGAPSVQSSAAQYTLKGVADEWQGAVGSGGRNGAATLRAWTTDDGALALALRGLRASTGYPVTIRRGTCCRGARDVCRVGDHDVSRNGDTDAGAQPVEGGGSPLGCRRLRGSWCASERGPWPAAARCPPSRSTARASHGASGSSPGSRRILQSRRTVPYPLPSRRRRQVSCVGGLHLQNDCTWEPINRAWSCRPPTRSATAVWTSGDGVSWSEQILGGNAGAGLVAAGATRTVVVANGASWWSTDGRSWVPASRPPAVHTAGGWGGGPGSVIATGAGFVAVGGDASAGVDPATTRAWTSTDGDTWTALPLDPDLAPLCVDDVVEGPSSLVAVGSDCNRHAAIAVSRDGGLTWERPTVGSSLTNATALDVVTHGSSGFVAYGQTRVRGIGVWASTDGRAWSVASVVPPVPHWDYLVGLRRGALRAGHRARRWIRGSGRFPGGRRPRLRGSRGPAPGAVGARRR